MSKKENFNKAVFEMFGVGSAQPLTEDKLDESAQQTLATAAPKAMEEPSHAAPLAAPYSLVPSTFLASGTTLEGKLKSKGDVEIAGSFNGEIVAEGNVTLRTDATCSIEAASLNVASSHLTGDCVISGSTIVSETSEVTGNITTDELHCSGTITGDIVVKNGLALEKTARIFGNISAGTLSVARGAIINGKLCIEKE